MSPLPTPLNGVPYANRKGATRVRYRYVAAKPEGRENACRASREQCVKFREISAREIKTKSMECA